MCNGHMREHSRRGGVLYSMRVCVRRVAPSLCSKIFPRKKTKWAESCRFSRKTFLSKRFHSQTTFCFVVCFFCFFDFKLRKLCVCLFCVCVCESACVYVSVVMYTRPQSLGIPWLTFSVSRSLSISLSLSDDLKKNKTTWVIISSTGSDTHHLSFSLSRHSLIIAMLIHQSSSNSTERRFSFYYLNGLNSS